MKIFVWFFGGAIICMIGSILEGKRLTVCDVLGSLMLGWLIWPIFFPWTILQAHGISMDTVIFKIK